MPQSDNESAFRAFAQQGYDLIIGHGDQYVDAADAVSKDFPNVKFLVTSTDKFQAPNVAALEVDNTDIGFVSGLLAGAVTKTKKVAYIGGEAAAAIIIPGKGFAQGVHYIDPSITVMTTYTGSYDDVAKAKETAKDFISKGCDVVLGNANQASLGVIQAAQESGVVAVGYMSDNSSVAPNTVVASSLDSYQVALPYVIKQFQDGQFQPKFYDLSVAQGAIGVAWNNAMASKIPAGAQDKVDQALADMKSGKLVVANLPS